MQTLCIPIDERLANPGDTWALKDHLNETGYSLGNHEFSLPQGIDFDVVLTNTGEGILATGMVHAEAIGVCDRCLEEARLDLTAEVDGYYLFHEPEQLAEDEDDVDFDLVSEDNTIDLSGALLSALVMETPFVVLCKEDCKGLCPVCGANLNVEDCGHAAELEKERIKASPFSALADIDFSE